MMKRRTWIQLFFVSLFFSCIPNCYGDTVGVMDARVAAVPTGLAHGLMKSEDSDTLTLELPTKSSDAQRAEFADGITIKNIPVPEPTGFFFAMLAVFTLLGGRHLMIARPQE